MASKKIFFVSILFLVLSISVVMAVEPFKLTVFTVENQTNPPEDNKIFKMMKEKLGVTFEWNIVSANKDEKIGVMIASGDFPDLVNIDSNKFIEAGSVVPLEDLVEKYAPNVKKHYAKVWEKIKEKDGHIYCLPNWGVIDGKYVANDYMGPALWIQRAVLKEFGYPKIKTMDEYFDLIKKYKAKYPTIDGKPTIGFSILTYDWHKFDLINPPQFLAGNPNDGNGVVDKKTYKYKVFLGEDISKRWFKKLNELNVQGLVDRESFVDNYDQYMTKLANGQVLGVHDQYWQFQDAMLSLKTQGKSERGMVPLPIVFDKNIKPWYRDRPLPNLQRGWGISIKAKDPVRIVKLWETCISEEWQKTFNWGIKGEDYLVDAKGVPYRTPEMRAQQDDITWKLKNKADIWFNNSPKLDGTFSNGLPTGLNYLPGEIASKLTPEDKELFGAYKVSSVAEMIDANPPDNPVYYPSWQITPPDGSPAQLAWKKAEDTYLKYLPKVVLADPKEFDKAWADYVDALAKCNLKVYEDYVQAGILERVKNWTPKK